MQLLQSVFWWSPSQSTELTLFTTFGKITTAVFCPLYLLPPPPFKVYGNSYLSCYAATQTGHFSKGHVQCTYWQSIMYREGRWNCELMHNVKFKALHNIKLHASCINQYLSINLHSLAKLHGNSMTLFNKLNRAYYRYRYGPLLSALELWIEM